MSLKFCYNEESILIANNIICKTNTLCSWYLDSPKLPGANGPNPQLSSGAKSLKLLKEGKFIDHTGSRLAGMEHGVFEMIWRKNAKAGALICGFDVPEDITRNDASIPKGRVYVVSCIIAFYIVKNRSIFICKLFHSL